MLSLVSTSFVTCWFYRPNSKPYPRIRKYKYKHRTDIDMSSQHICILLFCSLRLWNLALPLENEVRMVGGILWREQGLVTLGAIIYIITKLLATKDQATQPNSCAWLDRPGHLKSHLFCNIGKYFLSVRTGIGAHQVDPCDFNCALPTWCWALEVLTCSLLTKQMSNGCYVKP